MQGPQYQAGRTRLRRGTGSVVIGASGEITLTPTSGQHVTVAGGQLRIQNGTAAAPSLAFANFISTGFYDSFGGPAIGVSVNGTFTGYFDSNALGVKQLLLGSTPNTPDSMITRTGVASITFGYTPSNGNGQNTAIKHLTELTPIAAAATTDTTIQIPAGAQVVAVSSRVTVQPGGTSTVDSGVAGATTRYGTAFSTAANTTNRGTDDGIRYYASAVSVRYTPNAVPSDAAGRIRTTIHFLDITPPTS